eukprot:scaffold81472_cov20-Tisochrysis_lutea.AAC.4
MTQETPLIVGTPPPALASKPSAFHPSKLYRASVPVHLLARAVLPPPAWAVLQEQRELPVPSDPRLKRDRDGLVHLVAEVMAEGHSTLVFCGGWTSMFIRGTPFTCMCMCQLGWGRASVLSTRRLRSAAGLVCWYIVSWLCSVTGRPLWVSLFWSTRPAPLMCMHHNGGMPCVGPSQPDVPQALSLISTPQHMILHPLPALVCLRCSSCSVREHRVHAGRAAANQHGGQTSA